MITEALLAVEAWAPVAALRSSMLVYPLVNAGHILGVALLVGGIVPLDLRLAGLWSRTAIDHLMPVLAQTAMAGFMLAVVSGALLFATRASEYAASPLFLGKLLLIVLAGLNAAWFLRRAGGTGGAARASAIGSMILWIGVLLLGRLVGYF
ncbi:hypothetical protein HC341_11370 [Aquisalimonas sp. 2447]|uniref:hypothetical protein n=1 Tax=Aquisalimonas sp. 2447 TaxID=2740807 RepID=UPI0014327253|nr:hypothetical protein [Aquisalimonas sp. 2447]QIT55756.1 hypothetical protein HC341_11370 [Aquisalimonas sp. 2447]